MTEPPTTASTAVPGESAQPSREGVPAAGTITGLLVCYDETPEQIHTALDSLLHSSRAPLEVLVIDNSPGAVFSESLAGYHEKVRVIVPGANVGYSPAINIGAREARGDYFVTLNPDAHVEADCLERLAAVADTDASILLVGAQILLEDGVTKNAGANPLHPTGISPAGGFGDPREHGAPRDVAVVSGACCLTPS
jgi:GT2 family glycosyltransferase